MSKIVHTFNMAEDLLDVAVDFIADTTGQILASIGVYADNQNSND